MFLVDEETLKKYLEMEDQLKANAMLMQGYELSFEERLAEAKARALVKNKEEAKEQTVHTEPHFMNLNEDPLLSGKVLHSLQKGILNRFVMMT